MRVFRTEVRQKLYDRELRSTGMRANESMRSRRPSMEAVMPRYFFHVFDSKTWYDHEGKELTNWQAAQVVAILHMGTILQNNAAEISVGDDWHMDVMNETGILLFRLDFSIVRSAILDQITNKYISLGPNIKDL